jgi:predicted phosphodiesterase
LAAASGIAIEGSYGMTPLEVKATPIEAALPRNKFVSKIAVISDIHSNLQALEAVLLRIDDLACEKTYCLGDVVGYGANPNECITLLREREISSLQGNHDAVVSGQSSGTDFNEYAYNAAMENRRVLTEENLEYLLTMSETIRLGDHALMVHGSPSGRDHYLMGEALIAHMSELVGQNENIQLCFFGHTHIPSLYNGAGLQYAEADPFHLDPGMCTMVNPGSVGQPRDGDTRAAFTWWDTEANSVVFERVAYDVEAACQAILASDLPDFLGLRLRDGV